jgi:hypothetical protein
MFEKKKDIKCNISQHFGFKNIKFDNSNKTKNIKQSNAVGGTSHASTELKSKQVIIWLLMKFKRVQFQIAMNTVSAQTVPSSISDENYIFCNNQICQIYCDVIFSFINDAADYSVAYSIAYPGTVLLQSPMIRRYLHK